MCMVGIPIVLVSKANFLTLQVQILSALKSDLTTSLAALNPNIQLQLILFTVYHHTHIHVQTELLSYYVDHCFKPQFMRNPWVNPTGCHFSKLEKNCTPCDGLGVVLPVLSTFFSATQQKNPHRKDIYFLSSYLNLAVFKALLPIFSSNSVKNPYPYLPKLLKQRQLENPEITGIFLPNKRIVDCFMRVIQPGLESLAQLLWSYHFFFYICKEDHLNSLQGY